MKATLSPIPRLRTRAFASWIVVSLLLMLGISFAAPVSTRLASVQSSPGLSGAGGSYSPAFSSDGRFVVFLSHANNLVTNDDTGLNLDVFVRDLFYSNTVLVSVSSNGVGGANADANYPAISSNGQFVAFASAASNLVNNDTNDAVDVFWRETFSGKTRLVSRGQGGGNAAGPSPFGRYPLSSSHPLISADGNWIFFESSASNLVSQVDNNAAPDVFARNVSSETTILVSVNHEGDASANGPSLLAAVTPDARFALFISASTNLVSGVVETNEHVYLRDMAAGVTKMVSSNAGSFVSAPYACLHPIISDDGRYVVFKAQSPTSQRTVLLYHDQVEGTTSLISSNVAVELPAAMNSDGRYVAYDYAGLIYRRDTLTDDTLRITSAPDGSPPGATSLGAVLSRDGSKVAFVSAYTPYEGTLRVQPLTPNQSSSFDVFIRDLQLEFPFMASQGTNGIGTEDIFVHSPAFSPNGNRVAFSTRSAHLVADDKNSVTDVFVRDLISNETLLVSVRHGQLPASSGLAGSWLNRNGISSNGQVVAFTSTDGTLAQNDTNFTADAFVQMMTNGPARRLGNDVAGSIPPYTFSRAPVVSADGNAAVYFQGTNGMTTNRAAIYSFDLVTGSNRFVSVVTNISVFGTTPLPEPYPFPALSSDGRLVAFQTAAPVLTGGSSSLGYVTRVRDLLTGSNYLASRSMTGGIERESIEPQFSPDNNWLVFQSRAINMTTNVLTEGPYQLFGIVLPIDGKNPFPHQPTNAVRLISHDPLSLKKNGLAGNATGFVFSADSRYVAFHTATNPAIYRHDLLANNSNLLICTNCLNPSMNGNGRLVAYQSLREDGASDIRVRDLNSGKIEVITKSWSGAEVANGSSMSPQMSADGRFVVFASKASDLVENDRNHGTDVFVRDRLLGATFLVSLNRFGTGSGVAPSSNPILAQDGRSVVFQSFAEDLAAGDYNGLRDIYVARIGATDSDGDNLDDEWEIAFFGNLLRNGSGDLDQDGQSDRAEFLAGTDPTNVGSVLRVLTLNFQSGSTAIMWTAVPGRTYRVQYKDFLESGWLELPGEVTAAGSTALKIDSTATAPAVRIYRVTTSP